MLLIGSLVLQRAMEDSQPRRREGTEGGRPQQVYRDQPFIFVNTTTYTEGKSRHTHALGQPFNQKFKILTGPGEGNLVIAAKPNQPTGDPLTGFSLLCVQTVFLSFLVLEWE